GVWERLDRGVFALALTAPSADETGDRRERRMERHRSFPSLRCRPVSFPLPVVDAAAPRGLVEVRLPARFDVGVLGCDGDPPAEAALEDEREASVALA